MKFFANLKKLNKLGASMVEYAIVLACISAFGASFSDNLTNVLEKPFNSIATILGLESGGSQTQTIQQKIYDLFTGLNGNSHSGDPSQSLAKDIVSGGPRFLEGLAGIDTAYALHSYQITDRAIAAGLGIDNTNSYKLITVANQSGVQPTKGNKNDESTYFSATQYLFCQDGKNIYLAATRELDSVYIKTEAGHGTFTNKQGNEYTLKNNFSAAEYKVVDPTTNETKWVDITNLDSGFVKYQPK